MRGRPKEWRQEKYQMEEKGTKSEREGRRERGDGGQGRRIQGGGRGRRDKVANGRGNCYSLVIIFLIS